MSRFTSGFEGMHTAKGIHSTSRRVERNPILKGNSGVSTKTRKLVLGMAKAAGLNHDQMEELASTMRHSSAGRGAGRRGNATRGRRTTRRGAKVGAETRRRQAAVKAPRVGRGNALPVGMAPMAMSYRPMRKQAGAIAVDLRDIEESQRAHARSMMAPGATRHIPQSHKDVLQEAYLKREEAARVAQPKARAAPPKSTTEDAANMGYMQLFRAVEAEIKERQDFLDQMRALGQGKEHEAKIMGEISQRIAELKRLDALMTGNS